ncbi:Putative bacterial haemoglobin [hydrothermal vent metagenome]|uniref:Bacterial haemoglobin n=1 Tax=hydrothermal vent metagenome TaxID=652676 RepID=A0A3B0QZA5_9ZZZZ
MAINVELIRESFNNDIAPKADELVEFFYDDLFSRYSEVKPLFEKTDMPSQKKKLLASLKFLVENLEDTSILADALTSLGERHASYNVKAEHYPMVADSLLAALSEVMGGKWTPEVREAWTELYMTAAGIMQRACTA